MQRPILNGQFFHDKGLSIQQWLDSSVQGRYEIVDGVVNVTGDVILQKLDGYSIPVQFGHVSGGFDCNNNQLKSLVGAPMNVGDGFSCASNILVSLMGGPRTVGSYYSCSHNLLTSLKHAPAATGSFFICSNNRLTTLDGGPKTVGDSFFCNDNHLTSLSGAPAIVGGEFNCCNNFLTSLAGAPKNIGSSFNCSINELRSLEHAPSQVYGEFNCDRNNLVSLAYAPQQVHGNFFSRLQHKEFQLTGISREIYGKFECNYQADLGVMQLFQVKHLRLVQLRGFTSNNRSKAAQAVTNIINQYLPTRNFASCAARLVRAGFSGNARL